MTMPRLSALPRPCERAREYVSLRLDGELSAFETALLDLHLERCAACAEFAADTTVVTERLRTAPLERSARPAFVAQPIRLPRVASGRGVQTIAAAAVIATVVGLGSLLNPIGSSSSQVVTPSQANAVSTSSDRREFRDIRRQMLIHPRNVAPGGLGDNLTA